MPPAFLQLTCRKGSPLIPTVGAVGTVGIKACLALFAILVLLSAVKASAETSEMAPEFMLPDIHTGETVRLSDYRGKLVLVDFWASWCGSCRVSFPAYNKMRKDLHAKLGENAFEIIAINVDASAKEGLAFLEEAPVEFPVLHEKSGATQKNYQLIAMPTSFLIDPNGKILIAHQGFSQGYITQLEAIITEAVSKPL